MAEQIDDQDSPDTSARDTGTTAAEQQDGNDTLRREKDVLQDRLLRTAAEFDNYRKRVERERRDLVQYAGADILTDLLPIVDDLDRALQASSGGDAETYRRGVELIYRQMLNLLEKRGVRPIDAVGAQFDPRFHEAVVDEVSDAHREGEVMAELRKGYTLGERLLRPAAVKVAKA